MKVLMLNGSPKADGNTYTALLEIGKQLEKEGIGYEIVQIGAKPVHDCIGCNKCNDGGCIFTDDGVNAFIAKAKEADGFVFGTPVYYAHCLNKYFGISQMPVAGSTYWNNIHGAVPGEAQQDAEGLQIMRNLARNLAWMIKCFDAGKKNGIPLPEAETDSRTNFIR